jgi:ABC-type multidrug transport system fused ATPase/permease subunit
LLYFGEPIKVEPVALDADGNPPRDAVKELSTKIEKALREVMLDAEHEEALQTISRAERIFSSEANDNDSLTDELQLQQRFIKAYSVLQQKQPERLRRLEVRMFRFEEELKQAGVDPDELAPPSSTFQVFGQILKRTLIFLLEVGPATLGTIVHYPAYKLGGYLATRLSKEADDMISTIKIISAMLLFPLTWIVVFVVFFVLFNWVIATAALVIVPLSGFVAILFFEELDRSLGSLRALMFFLVRRRYFVRLLAERKAIRNEILAMGREELLTQRRTERD